MTNIRIRLFAYLFIIFLISFSALFGITAYFITQEYSSFERDLEIKNTKQLQKGYKNILDSLSTKGRDWSIWDDAYDFMKSGNKKFIESNLTTDTVCSMDINYIVFVDLEGQITAYSGCDLKTKTELQLPSNFSYHISKGRLLINHVDTAHIYEGSIETSSGPLIITAQPIVKTSGDGPVRGTLVLARFLTKDVFSIYAPPETQVSLQQITIQQYDDILVKTPDDNTIVTSFDLLDIYNNPITRVNSQTNRVIYNKRILAYRYIFVSLFSAGFLLLLGQFFTTELLITKKISALIQAIRHISTKEGLQNVDIPIISKEKDEFYTLQCSLNDMTQSIKKLSSNFAHEQQNAQQYIDIMNTIIRVLDKNHNIVLINKNGCKILGYKKEELIGKNWIEFIAAPEDRATVSTLLDSFYLDSKINKDSVENQSEIVTKLGERRLIRWHHSLVRDEKGVGISLVSSGFDMTDELNAKSQLEQQMKELQQMNKIMVNRELAMIELKKKIKQYET